MVTVASDFGETESHLERVSNIKMFRNKYNWKVINYSSKPVNRKSFEKKNRSIVLNILYMKEKEIFLAFISKISLNCQKQIILLTIRNEEKGGYIQSCSKKTIYIINMNEIKTSCNFYCLNCLHCFRTQNKHESHEKVCKIKISVEL